MKKLLTMVCTILVLLGMSCGADAAVEKELRFRGAEWNKPYAETMRSLEGMGVKWRDPKTSSGRSIRQQADGSWSGYYDHDCLYSVDLAYNSPTIQVAGYEVSDVDLYFAFTPDENGRIPQDAGHTAFYMAKYTIKPKDLDGVFDDLRLKLSALYGEPDRKFSDGWIIHYNIAVWNGEGDTRIMMISDDNWDSIYINYIWDGG